MRLQGRIVSWNDSRGFGFIEWNGGAERVFAHISAFKQRRRTPVVGDVVTYEVQNDASGRRQAVRIAYVGADHPEQPVLSARRAPSSSKRTRLGKLVTPLMLVTLGATAYHRYENALPRAEDLQTVVERSPPEKALEPHRFECDGRIHCSEMNSCEEATFFVRHCPGTEMDGDGDGIPCEDQWCGH
jgi:cold shock CspA family protein